ncbi:MAG: hypothetical protein CMM94_02835 [Rickettsiales bacterium]|nr:hypothetical protein [Rickettsiales bacterium]
MSSVVSNATRFTYCRMSSKRFIALFVTIFIVGALPFIIIQPSGAASAGLSSGFTMPIENIAHLLMLLAIGVVATFIGRDAILLLPLCFVLMFVVGAALHIDSSAYPMIRMFILGAILLFAMAVGLIRSKRGLFAVAMSASLAYHLGMYYMKSVPEIAAPIYFVVGNILCLILIMATSISFGLTLMGESEPKKKAEDEGEELANA